MMLTMLLVAAGVISPESFSQSMEVAQPIRLQLTPVLDGNMAAEEWDPFTSQTFLQWEPGRLYVAGQLPVGKDLVLSVDRKGDGWLVGRDNLEFRVTQKDGKAVVRVRELDATAIRQPIWRDRHDLETASEAVIGAGDGTTCEAVFDDAGLGILPRKPRNEMIRLDVVDSAEEIAAYQPRVCESIRFDDRRTAALPREMVFGAQAPTRAVFPGESFWMRLNFNGSEKFGVKAIDMRSLGDAELTSNKMSLVFPSFDNKGRAFVDYSSKVEDSATVGFKILRGTLSFKDGPSGLVETSYRVAPLLGFSLQKSEFDKLPENNTLRLPYVVQLFTRKAVAGLVRISLPEGWQIAKGDAAKFDLLGNQSAELRHLEVRAPADAHGTFPIRFTAETKDRTLSQTCYVTIR
jgi:hypothetical protein